MLLTSRQCRQFDQIAIEEYGVPGIALMENAGVSCVREFRKRGMLEPTIILCGSGNNAGDGFVIARHLYNESLPVSLVLLADESKLRGDAKVNFEIIKKMNGAITRADASWSKQQFTNVYQQLGPKPLVIDAILGTGVVGDLRQPVAAAVEAANEHDAIRVAIDIPTGLNADSGRSEFAFRADLTCTFIAPKTGFRTPEAAQYLGEVVLCDIGAPHGILGRFEGTT